MSESRLLYCNLKIYEARYNDINRYEMLKIFLHRWRLSTSKDRLAAMAVAFNYRNFKRLVETANSTLPERACYDFVKEAKEIAISLGLMKEDK